MVEDSDLGAAFGALAHAARRDMLLRLAEGELTVSELAAPLSMSLAAASKHVGVLERAGLIRRIVDGRRHVCLLEHEQLTAGSAWIAGLGGAASAPGERAVATDAIFRTCPVPDMPVL